MDQASLDLALDPPLDLRRLIVVGALGAARVVPVFAIAPLFGGRLVPTPLRVAAALGIVALVYPALEAASPGATALGPTALAALIVKEVAIGALLGFLAGLPLFAAEAAGRLVDTARGANLAEALVPQTGAASSPLGDLGFQLAVVAFLAMDGHLLFLRGLALSYEALPALAWPAPAGVAGAMELVLAATSRTLLAALAMAAPALAALFLADVALGLVNRVAPSIGVYFVGMPAKAVVGLGALLLALGAIVAALRGELAAGLASVDRMVRSLN